MLDPITGELRVLAPGHTFKSVTEKIAGIVLTSHTPLGWFAGFCSGRRHCGHAAGGRHLALS